MFGGAAAMRGRQDKTAAVAVRRKYFMTGETMAVTVFDVREIDFVEASGIEVWNSGLGGARVAVADGADLVGALVFRAAAVGPFWLLGGGISPQRRRGRGGSGRWSWKE